MIVDKPPSLLEYLLKPGRDPLNPELQGHERAQKWNAQQSIDICTRLKQVEAGTIGAYVLEYNLVFTSMVTMQAKKMGNLITLKPVSTLARVFNFRCRGPSLQNLQRGLV